jgi:hypothetical protein
VIYPNKFLARPPITMLGVRRTNRTSAITDQAHHELIQFQKGWISSLPYCLAFKMSTNRLELLWLSYLQMAIRCMYMISGWNQKLLIDRLPRLTCYLVQTLASLSRVFMHLLQGEV